jgi:hypothetical protein
MSSNPAIAVRMARAAMEACACPPNRNTPHDRFGLSDEEGVQGNWPLVQGGDRCAYLYLSAEIVDCCPARADQTPLPGESPDSNLRELLSAASQQASQPEKANYVVTVD